jgi:hypothetical protein
MKSSRITILLLLLLLVGCRGTRVPITDKYSGKESPDPPDVTVNAVGRAHIEGPGETDIYGGTCFLLESKSGPLIVGAYHVLNYVKSDSKLTLVSKIPELATPKGDPVDVPYQSTSSYEQIVEECYARGDLAAYRTDEVHKKAQVLEMAMSDVKIGEPVWIVELKGSSGNVKGHKLVPGVVKHHSNHSLVIKLKKKSNVKATSGAPVVNADGKVVGVNVGFSQNPDGYFRIAVPGESVRRLSD